MPSARVQSFKRFNLVPVLLLATGLTVSAVTFGHAAQPVIDATSHVKLTEQLNVAREQMNTWVRSPSRVLRLKTRFKIRLMRSASSDRSAFR